MNNRIENLCNTIYELSKVVKYYQDQCDRYKAAIEDFSGAHDAQIVSELHFCLRCKGAEFETL